MKKLIVLIPMLSFLFSCVTEEKADSIYTKSFVLGYYELESLSLFEREGNCIAIFENNKPGIIDRRNRTAEFDAINVSHNDINYNRKILYIVNVPNIYISPDFASVSIISDADYDAEHKAGVSLADITQFLSISPIKYIKSGYVDTFNWKGYAKYNEFIEYWPLLASSNNQFHDPLGPENVHPIDSRVSELSSDDLCILGHGTSMRPNWYPLAVIKFNRQPTLSKDHNISIKFTDMTGKEYVSNEIKLSF